jgi:hypothetical protein
MLLPTAPFSAPPAGAPATPQAAPARVLGGVALSSAAVIPLLEAPTAGGWLMATALAAGAVAVLPADRSRQQDARERGLAAPAAPEAALTEDELTERLRALHDAHVEEANMALAEGREDLVQASSDRYTDAALALLTSTQHPAG